MRIHVSPALPRAALLALAASVLLAAAAPPAAWAVPWFPSSAGPTFTYPFGTVVITPGDTPADFHRGWCVDGAPWGCSVETFAVDGNGDVLYRSISYSAPAMPDPDLTTYDPPLVYLDFPLEAGRTWSSDSFITNWYPVDPAVPVTLTGSVAGPQTVTVAAGTFDVVVVRLELRSAAEPWRDWTRELWLHPQLGPVNDLLAWTGVVSAAPVSWGSLKACYR